MDALIPLFVAIPLISAFLMVILGKLVKGFHRFLAPVTLLALLLMAVYEFTSMGGTSLAYAMGGWTGKEGSPLGIFLVLDGFSVIMLCIINLIGLVALFYSLSYMAKYTAEANY
jgi:formate hydrogenlyase subunit 3/multisubunit Na+/H+ antiporter MnhD subunit